MTTKKKKKTMMMMMMMRYFHHLVLSENPNSQLAIIQNSREKWVAHELAHQSEGVTTIIVVLGKKQSEIEKRRERERRNQRIFWITFECIEQKN